MRSRTGRTRPSAAWAKLGPVVLAAVLLVGLLPVAHLPLGTAKAQRSLVASDPVTVTAVAVAETSDGGLTGVSARVHATVVRNGSGQVFVATKPLAQTDMQGSARLAARVAAEMLGLDWRRYDYFVVFESESVVIGGPSAGATMTLAVATALNDLTGAHGDWDLDPRVAMTGTINPDGTVGPVGGIPEKAQAAEAAGIDLFLFPAGQERAARTGPGGGRTVVEMDAFCRDRLGITCRPVATARDALEKAGGVRLEAPPVPEPSTAGYAEVIGPEVAPLVARLGERVEDAGTALDAARGNLTDGEEDLVGQSLAEAEGNLDRARTALDEERFYTAATMTFRGSIHVGHAENLTRMFASSNPSSVVAEAVATCQAAASGARDHAYPLTADGMNALFAVGAAQTRVAQAEELLRDADRRFRAATSPEGWVQALFDASFCTERAGTVLWWAGLRDAFGTGPAVEDPAGLARDVVDLARENVFYAEAVLRGGDAGRAPGMLEEAEAALEAGRYPHAVVVAAEAQAEASIAVMAAVEIPPAVIDAARAAASREIAEARAAGVEPVLSVSLFELSQAGDGNRTALSFLWTARSLAALVPAEDPRPPTATFVGSPPELDRTPREERLLIFGALTGFLGGLLVAVVAVVVLGVGRGEEAERDVSARRRREGDDRADRGGFTEVSDDDAAGGEDEGAAPAYPRRDDDGPDEGPGPGLW